MKTLELFIGRVWWCLHNRGVRRLMFRRPQRTLPLLWLFAKQEASPPAPQPWVDHVSEAMDRAEAAARRTEVTRV